MFDYMTKIRLRAYNSRKVVGVSRLECSLTVGEANEDKHDPMILTCHARCLGQSSTGSPWP